MSEEMLEAAFYEPVTGRKMTVMTDLPAVLLYTAGYYDRPDTAICLKHTIYPDTLLIRFSFLPGVTGESRALHLV